MKFIMTVKQVLNKCKSATTGDSSSKYSINLL